MRKIAKHSKIPIPTFYVSFWTMWYHVIIGPRATWLMTRYTSSCLRTWPIPVNFNYLLYIWFRSRRSAETYNNIRNTQTTHKKEELHKRLHWKEKKSNSQHIMTVVQHWNMCTNYNTLLPTTKLQQNIIFALCSTIKLVTRGLQQHGGQRTSITKSRAVQHIQFYDPLSNRTMIQPNLLIDALL